MADRLKNTTVTLTERALDWARVRAAELDVSLSRYLGELIHREMRHSRQYQEAMQRFMAQKPVRLRRPGERYLTREEANDRAGLRRR